jgi:hypothetical protein
MKLEEIVRAWCGCRAASTYEGQRAGATDDVWVERTLEPRPLTKRSQSSN